MEQRVGYKSQGYREMRKILFKNWFYKNDGVTAIEFALIGPPFFLLVLGIMEIGMFFAAGSVLEGASNDAARLIRTGAVQLSADPETTFNTELCDKVGAMLDCTKLQYEVIQMADNSFATAADYTPTFDDEGNLVPAGFSAGNSNDVVLIRAVYKYEFLTPYIGTMITGDMSRNWAVHMATVVLKAEPYRFGEK